MNATIPEILEQLRLNRGGFPRRALEAAVAKRDEIVPELLHVLDEAIAQPEGLLADTAVMSHIYALYLLAQFREPAAYEAVSLLTPLFRGRVEREPSNVWNGLVSVATDLHATEHAADVRRAFEEEVVDSCFISPHEVEETLQEPRELVLERSRRRSKGLILHTVREMSWWACFDQNGRQRERAPSDLRPIRRTEPKIGRNAPCPCGSGKKYRKCCDSRAGNSPTLC